MIRVSRLALLLAWMPAMSATTTAAVLTAMVSSATLTGHLQDDRHQPVAGAHLVLANRATGFRQVAQSDAKGRYVFYNVPFNDYHLEISARDAETVHRDLELRAALPLTVDFELHPAGATVAVEDTVNLVEAHPAAHLDIDQSTIERMPAAVQSRAMEAILLTTPGFIQDENGRFHFRGSHGQATYVVDGIPVSDQVHATFSNSMDPSQVESMEVITGGISAEYGGKPVAVINMTTKTGLATEGGFKGEVSAGASRFDTAEAGFSVRGGSDRFGYFTTGATSRSDRFLDPVNFENLHNHGATGRLFNRFDWILSDQDTLRASISGGRTSRDVANLASQELRGQDQRVATSDANLSLAWTHLFGTTRSLDASLYYRHAAADLDPTADLEPGFTGSGPDYPVWVRQHRTLDNQGAQIAFTQRFPGDSTLKAGLQYVGFPIQERFRFAITEDSLAPDADDPMHAYTPAGGGHIFDFNGKIKPVLASAFAQGDVHLGAWFLALGLRYDHYTVEDITQAQLQPRIGLSYRVVATGTVLRASYDRLLVTRENENLALSLSQQAWDLGPYHGTPRAPLRPELQDSYSYGVEQQISKRVRFTLEYWEKQSWNAGDNEQFLNTGVLFPIAAARGLFHGMNARLDVVPLAGFSAYLSLGKTRAIFQAPTVGGLQLEMPEAAPGERYLIDHDQKLSAQLGLRYDGEAFFAQATGRYDSGLVAGDPTDATGNPDLQFGLSYIRRDSEGTWRVDPRTIWDFSAGRELKLQKGRTLTLSADLLNAFDKKGLYNFLSTFGGTHVIPPRTLALHVKFAF